MVIDSRTYHLLPGEILMIPPRTMHELIAPDSGSRFICLFNIEIFSPLRDYVGVQSLLKTPLYIRPAEYAQIYGEIYEQFEMIWEEYFGNVEFYEFSAYSHLLQIFTLLARYQINLNHAFSAASAARQLASRQRSRFCPLALPKAPFRPCLPGAACLPYGFCPFAPDCLYCLPCASAPGFPS